MPGATATVVWLAWVVWKEWICNSRSELPLPTKVKAPLRRGFFVSRYRKDSSPSFEPLGLRGAGRPHALPASIARVVLGTVSECTGLPDRLERYPGIKPLKTKEGVSH